ncbi:MAG TPA: SRPBCC domain-containing protein [Bacteroidia bacterium]|nr:SRPBCC domain-containing protein [Bacteroidia bacterium]
MDKLKLSVTLPAPPKRIYEAWLNGKEHSAFTGSKATASAKVNGRFTAWDGYISGSNIDLKEGKKIVQAWRTTEFPDTALDSVLEVSFVKAAGGKTKLTLTQINIPKGQGVKYKGGWKTHYFEPMKEYFSKKK